MLRRMLTYLITACVVLAAPLAIAAEALPRYNVIELQSEAQREVQNDLLSATLFVELNDANPAALANALNKSVNEALRIAKQHTGVRVRSGNNQTYPVYDKGNAIQSWRGRAEVRIESKDFESATALVGKLQSSMQLANLSFSVSPATRRTTEDELVVEAIGAFKARAEIARSALAGRGYKLVRINLGNSYVPPQPRMAAVRMAAPAQAVTAPNVEAGTSLVTVTASGAIEILE